MMRMAEAAGHAQAGEVFDAAGREEAARGYMLLGVFFIHSLFDMAEAADPGAGGDVNALIKLLAPQISMFFFLSGMSSRGIGKRRFRRILEPSLMLIFLSWISHALGLAMQDALYGGAGSPLQFLGALAMPIIEGTGGVTFVTWFFTVLAVARILVWLYERDKRWFGLAWVAIIALVYAGKALNLPDNLYEWRSLPTATLFMLAGMKIPPRWRVRWVWGMAAGLAALALTWVNRPDLLNSAPCLACGLDFFAEPMVGSYGSLPVYLAAEMLFFIFLLWGAQLRRPIWPSHVARYFGRFSLQFLLMHGWLLVTIEPYLADNYFPPNPGKKIILAAFVLGPVVHAAAFFVLAKPLNWVVARCFLAARFCTSLAGMGAARKEASTSFL
jgi:hypothetical protein